MKLYQLTLPEQCMRVLVFLQHHQHNIFTQLFFTFAIFKKIFLNFIYLWLCWVFISVRGLSQLRQAGATLHRGARASHYRSLSGCGAQAPDAQAQ